VAREIFARGHVFALSARKRGLSEEDSSSSVRRAGVTQTDKDKRD